MSQTEARLAAMGLELPQTSPPAANYVPFSVSGRLVFMAGQLCIWNGERHYTGKLGAGISMEQGVAAAQMCGLNLLAWLKVAAGGDLDLVTRCVRLGGFVNSTTDFSDQPKVMNGCSDLMVAVFGEAGRHARSAVGVNVLPFDLAVEVDAIFELNI